MLTLVDLAAQPYRIPASAFGLAIAPSATIASAWHEDREPVHEFPSRNSATRSSENCVRLADDYRC